MTTNQRPPNQTDDSASLVAGNSAATSGVGGHPTQEEIDALNAYLTTATNFQRREHET